MYLRGSKMYPSSLGCLTPRELFRGLFGGGVGGGGGVNIILIKVIMDTL